MNDEEVREYKKHLRARSEQSLEVLRRRFLNKKSERCREEKMVLIDEELERRRK